MLAYDGSWIASFRSCCADSRSASTSKNKVMSSHLEVILLHSNLLAQFSMLLILEFSRDMEPEVATALEDIYRQGVCDNSDTASNSQPGSGAEAGRYSSRARDTGIQLAAADNEEYEFEKRRAIEKYFGEKDKRRLLGVFLSRTSSPATIFFSAAIMHDLCRFKHAVGSLNDKFLDSYYNQI